VMQRRGTSIWERGYWFWIWGRILREIGWEARERRSWYLSHGSRFVPRERLEASGGHPAGQAVRRRRQPVLCTLWAIRHIEVQLPIDWWHSVSLLAVISALGREQKQHEIENAAINSLLLTELLLGHQQEIWQGRRIWEQSRAFFSLFPWRTEDNWLRVFL
jgi:hypothetical protein